MNKTFACVVLIEDGHGDSDGESFMPGAAAWDERASTIPVCYDGREGIGNIIGKATLDRSFGIDQCTIYARVELYDEAVKKYGDTIQHLTPAIIGSTLEKRGKAICSCTIREIGLFLSANRDERIQRLGIQLDGIRRPRDSFDDLVDAAGYAARQIGGRAVTMRECTHLYHKLIAGEISREEAQTKLPVGVRVDAVMADVMAAQALDEIREDLCDYVDPGGERDNQLFLRDADQALAFEGMRQALKASYTTLLAYAEGWRAVQKKKPTRTQTAIDVEIRAAELGIVSCDQKIAGVKTFTGYHNEEAYIRYNDGHDDSREAGVLRGKADFSQEVFGTPSEVSLEARVLKYDDILEAASRSHTETPPLMVSPKMFEALQRDFKITKSPEVFDDIEARLKTYDPDIVKMVIIDSIAGFAPGPNTNACVDHAVGQEPDPVPTEGFCIDGQGNTFHGNTSGIGVVAVHGPGSPGLEALRKALEAGGYNAAPTELKQGCGPCGAGSDQPCDTGVAKSVCECDMKDLMSTGHDDDCPEKKP